MFNVTGGEVVIILVLALVVLGPEKLPDMLRKAGRLYGELRRMSSGFQSEFEETFGEPLREFRETANQARDMMRNPLADHSPADQTPIAADDSVPPVSATEPSAPPLIWPKATGAEPPFTSVISGRDMPAETQAEPSQWAPPNPIAAPASNGATTHGLAPRSGAGEWQTWPEAGQSFPPPSAQLLPLPPPAASAARVPEPAPGPSAGSWAAPSGTPGNPWSSPGSES